LQNLRLLSINTNRIHFRRLSAGDAERLSALRSDEVVNKYLERSKACSPDEALIFIDKINKSIDENKSFYWALTLRPNMQLIGTICFWNFSDDRKTAELGYELATEFHGKGLMTEAMRETLSFAKNELKLETIIAFTHPDNSASIKLLNNFGFKRDKELETEYANNDTLGFNNVMILNFDSAGF
jgi:ribosomal-protein-alanine N-acetyltransferase